MTFVSHPGRTLFFQACRSRRPCLAITPPGGVPVCGYVSSTTDSKSASTSSSHSHSNDSDDLNPPHSTLPPRLSLPDRSEIPSAFRYYFRLGRAYGKFYWAGIKAIHHNHRSAKSTRRALDNALPRPFPRRLGIFRPDATELYLALLRHQHSPRPRTSSTSPTHRPTRAEFQSLIRDQRDWAKTPVFGVLVLLLGEWLPLFVPFFPSLVPRTCRIPRQIEAMRRAAEARRSRVFRDGSGDIGSVDDSTLPPSPSTGQTRAAADDALLQMLTGSVPDAIYALPKHTALRLSASLGLHRPLWETVGLAPPGEVLRAACRDHLRYLGVDDFLLLRPAAHGVRAAGPEVCSRIVELLNDREVEIACEERGLDVLGRPDTDLRRDLVVWLRARTGTGTVSERGHRLLFNR